MMKLPFLPILLSTLLGCMLMATGCSSSKDEKSNAEKNANVSTDVRKELATAQIKSFPATEHDAHDIALLIEYDQKFNAMNTQLEAELKKMLDEGNLTPEFELRRKQDSIRSSLNMLKELDLKTEQGRYIQGLLYQYWEKQDKRYKNPQSNSSKQQPSNSVKGVGDLITANNQLEYWKSQNSYQNTEQSLEEMLDDEHETNSADSH